MKRTQSCITWKRKIGINWNFGNKLFLFISSDSCHKKMLLESLNIPLIFFFFLSRQLVKFFALFYSVLFCFCFQKFHPPPLISNGSPLSLFFYTDRWWQTYVIDNFELPCNSVKNLIPIWNFTNTFIQECKIIWELQIRWGGTSLLRPLWGSWRYLKAYSLMSNTGHFPNFINLIFFFFFFFAYFRSPPLRSTIIGWNHSSKSNFYRKSRTRDFIQHSSLWGAMKHT